MRILFIAGASVFTNYSTNFFKRTIIKGLKEAGNDVTVIQTNNKNNRQKYNQYGKDGVKYFEYCSASIRRSIWIRVKRVLPQKWFLIAKKERVSTKWKMDYGKKYINTAKELFSGEFDIVLSVSHPVTSHRLAYELISTDKIKYSKWFQIWLEYWYNDPKIPQKDMQLIYEEGQLLHKCDAIFYSNQLLLDNQSKIFPEMAYKMRYFDMPFSKVKSLYEINQKFTIGYFGTYHSLVRHIEPFYNAVSNLNLRTFIVGQSDVCLSKTELISIINDKIPADECGKMEDSVDLLIVLCNWHNDLVPGKLYMYAMTKKPILIILDGPQKGKQFIRQYFGKYNRFYFCDNNEYGIREILKIIQKEYQTKEYKIIEDFLPKNVISSILKGLDSPNRL